MANEKKKGEEAKASEPSKEKKSKKAQEVKTKKEKQDNEEWLEEELEEVKLDEETDALMKRAAEQIEQHRAEIKEWKDNYMRLHAEWDTYRRRTAEQRLAERASASEALVADLLPVLDDFERSINFAEESAGKANKAAEGGLLEGVKAVYAKTITVLEKNGVEVIDPEEGEAFDSLEHQAVATVENKDVYDESIAGVMQKGYKMGKKVIRPAMVSVTTGGEPRPKAEDDEEASDDSSKD